MKNLLSILVVLAIATTFSFAQTTVNDNLTVNKTGTGSFNCRVLTPLAVSVTSETNDLGVFVAAPSAPYSGSALANSTFTWNITGENDHQFHFFVESDLDGTETSNTGIATITIDWSYAGSGVLNGALDWYKSANPATLSSTGSYWVKATVTSLTALASGSVTFPQKITVSYTTL